jgi:hypothetical protein
MSTRAVSFRKKGLTILAGIVFGLGLLALINFIPTFFLQTPGMQEKRGEFLNLYYEKEEAAALTVFDAAQAEAKRLSATLGWETPPPLTLYVYDRQGTFQTKKYGFIALLLSLDWYVGDNRGTAVLATSPAHPGKAHSGEDVFAAIPHEMVHAYNSLLNPGMPLWLDEGLALYLTNGNPPKDLYRSSRILPSIEQMRTENPLAFEKINGYLFAPTYVEYLQDALGWEGVLSLAKSADRDRVFDPALYEGWIQYLQAHYQ